MELAIWTLAAYLSIGALYCLWMWLDPAMRPQEMLPNSWITKPIEMKTCALPVLAFGPIVLIGAAYVIARETMIERFRRSSSRRL